LWRSLSAAFFTDSSSELPESKHSHIVRPDGFKSRWEHDSARGKNRALIVGGQTSLVGHYSLTGLDGSIIFRITKKLI
jgi:hypothetical protein